LKGGEPEKKTQIRALSEELGVLGKRGGCRQEDSKRPGGESKRYVGEWGGIKRKERWAFQMILG